MVLGGEAAADPGVIDVIQLVLVLATRPAERVMKKTSSPLAEASAKKEGLGLVPVESR